MLIFFLIVVTGDDKQTQYLLNLGVIEHVFKFFSSVKKNLRKESCKKKNK